MASAIVTRLLQRIIVLLTLQPLVLESKISMGFERRHLNQIRSFRNDQRHSTTQRVWTSTCTLPGCLYNPTIHHAILPDNLVQWWIMYIYVRWISYDCVLMLNSNVCWEQFLSATFFDCLSVVLHNSIKCVSITTPCVIVHNCRHLSVDPIMRCVSGISDHFSLGN